MTCPRDCIGLVQADSYGQAHANFSSGNPRLAGLSLVAWPAEPQEISRFTPVGTKSHGSQESLPELIWVFGPIVLHSQGDRPPRSWLWEI